MPKHADLSQCTTHPGGIQCSRCNSDGVLDRLGHSLDDGDDRLVMKLANDVSRLIDKAIAVDPGKAVNHIERLPRGGYVAYGGPAGSDVIDRVIHNYVVQYLAPRTLGEARALAVQLQHFVNTWRGAPDGMYKSEIRRMLECGDSFLVVAHAARAAGMIAPKTEPRASRATRAPAHRDAIRRARLDDLLGATI
jgi:hypothetical protein